ncbi:MAG: phosphoglucomutase [Gammaproteobacteria bacterium RIFCSPHIGHO2_12_FULL_37_34]|nr:MAG: phosphoglucomutase [Gammaproteobacteria bacterium RIFCSPHIGHO2_12_FULL_37_34]
MQTIDPSIFRAYDIRGMVGKTLTENHVFLIGKVLGSLVCEQNEHHMLLARDGRLSGPALAQSLTDGILSTGCNVIDLGMVPTPLLYYATQVLDEHSGMMLTGSHNPPEYNGLKIVIKGVTLIEEQIKNIYQRILNKHFYQGNGMRQTLDITERYMTHVCRDIQLARPLRVVIDAGNGVAGKIAPVLFKQLGCEVHELFCEIDGSFPYHHPDPSQPENLQDLIRIVQEKKADIGIAFDGDGDRLGVVTNRGKIIWPDRLLMLFAQAVLRQYAHAKIIYDVKCSNHLAKMIHALGGQPIMWKTGHSLIKAKLIAEKAQLAGEMSGHFFFKDRWNGFDDALYAAARLLEILSQQTNDSDAVFAAIPDSVNTPELKVTVADDEKFSLMQKLIAGAKFLETHELMTIDGVRVNFADGWGLVRPSNTTPCLVLRFEAMNEASLKKIQHLFREWMLSVKPDLVLSF